MFLTMIVSLILVSTAAFSECIPMSDGSWVTTGREDAVHGDDCTSGWTFKPIKVDSLNLGIWGDDFHEEGPWTNWDNGQGWSPASVLYGSHDWVRELEMVQIVPAIHYTDYRMETTVYEAICRVCLRREWHQRFIPPPLPSEFERLKGRLNE